MAVLCGLLLSAASLSYAQGGGGHTNTDDYTFTYDTHGRLYQAIKNGGTVLMTVYYRWDTDTMPNSYQVPGGLMHWVSAEDLNFINTWRALITPTMTPDQFNAIMAGLNQIWAINNATNPYPRPGTPHTNGSTGMTRADWVERCDDIYMKAGMLTCAFFPPATTKACMSLMTAGYAACVAEYPLLPQPVQMPVDYIWCKGDGIGSYNPALRPGACGPDPDVLLISYCTEDLDGQKLLGKNYGYITSPPRYSAGGYLGLADCLQPPDWSVRATGIVEYYAICPPGSPTPAIALDQIWVNSGYNPIPWACVNHNPPH